MSLLFPAGFLYGLLCLFRQVFRDGLHHALTGGLIAVLPQQFKKDTQSWQRLFLAAGDRVTDRIFHGAGIRTLHFVHDGLTQIERSNVHVRSNTSLVEMGSRHSICPLLPAHTLLWPMRALCYNAWYWKKPLGDTDAGIHQKGEDK